MVYGVSCRFCGASTGWCSLETFRGLFIHVLVMWVASGGGIARDSLKNDFNLELINNDV